MLSRYTIMFDGSKISNLPIDLVYPRYVHYGNFKGNLLIKMRLIVTYKSHNFHAYVFNKIVIPYS